MCSSLQGRSDFTSFISPHLYCAIGIAHTHIVQQLNDFQPEFVAIQMLGGKPELSNAFCSFCFLFFFPRCRQLIQKASTLFFLLKYLMTGAKHSKEPGIINRREGSNCFLQDREIIFFNHDAHKGKVRNNNARDLLGLYFLKPQR